MSDKPPVGSVAFGDFARTEPIGGYFSRERGTSVDRFYVAAFLDKHCGDVAGRVLEIEESRYTRRFGGERVTRSDVLDMVHGGAAEELPAAKLWIQDARYPVTFTVRAIRAGSVALP